MAKIITDEKLVNEILSRGVAEVIDRANLKKKLLSGKKLRIKFGIDPTSPSLHLGRAVVLLKLKDLQDLGHQIVLLIGDFTGVIGDTSDKESERPMLSREIIKKNLKTYLEQAGKILDMKKVESRYNSEWLEKLGYGEIGEQADQFSLAEFIARENIKKRLEAGTRISLCELLYPLMQGYDSVALKSDLELGGTDQRFNLLAGRTLQNHFGQESQDILMMNLIEGTDGRKMSSSWGNTINILDDANMMFGKIMSAGDELIVKYFIHCTRVPMESIKKIEKQLKAGEVNPRDIKIKLAFEITKIYHGEKKAQEAREYFMDVHSRGKFLKIKIKNKIKIKHTFKIEITKLIMSAKFATSLSDARRKIEQGGVSLNGEKIADWAMIIRKESDDGKILRVGKIHIVEIKFV